MREDNRHSRQDTTASEVRVPLPANGFGESLASQMKKDLLLRKHPLVAAAFVVAAGFAILFAFYGLTRWTSQEKVMGRVDIAGVPIGGLTEEEARQTILDIEDDYQNRVLTFELLGQDVMLDASETGLSVPVDDLLDEAMAMGREGNFPYQFLWWLQHIFATEEIGLRGTTQTRALNAVFDDWDRRVIGRPPTHGGIAVEDGQLVATHPVAGTGIDRTTAAVLLEEAVLALEPETLTIPTEHLTPVLTVADIDAAYAEAQTITGSSISLVADTHNLTFTSAQLLTAYVGTTVTEGEPGVVHSFDPEVIDELLAPLRAQYEARPVNARFDVNGDNIRVIPGRKGTRIDENEAVEQLLRAAQTPNRRGTLPIVEGADPAETTEMLQNMGVRHLVSEFTTHYTAGQPRVTNIRLMAEEVSMARVPPGGRFDLNAYVGPRTEQKGYVMGGTLIGGILEDTIGGGVSQFATTLYNAVFWGGYQDAEHRPHTVWFSRYPEGIEATINWGGPDLIFINNTPNTILLHTQSTATSVTVRIFGDNDGRTVKGQHREPNRTSQISVVNEGGPNARRVSAVLSERFNDTEPRDPMYRGDSTYGVDQVTQVQSARPGWSVTVTRTITRGGEEVGRREWLVVYRSQQAIYVVHPCKVPGSSTACPQPPTTTTTTTTSTSTTTTIPGDDDDDG